MYRVIRLPELCGVHLIRYFMDEDDGAIRNAAIEGGLSPQTVADIFAESIDLDETPQMKPIVEALVRGEANQQIAAELGYV